MYIYVCMHCILYIRPVDLYALVDILRFNVFPVLRRAPLSMVGGEEKKCTRNNSAVGLFLSFPFIFFFFFLITHTADVLMRLIVSIPGTLPKRNANNAFNTS
jgi:hypothetical protein